MEQPTLTDRFSNSAHFSLTPLFSIWRLINTLQEWEEWGEGGLVREVTRMSSWKAGHQEATTRSLQSASGRAQGEPYWEQAEGGRAAGSGVWEPGVKGRPGAGPAAAGGKQAERREPPSRAHLRVGALLRVAAAQDGARLILQLLVLLEHVHQRHYGLQLRLAASGALGSSHPQLSRSSAARPRRRREK